MDNNDKMCPACGGAGEIRAINVDGMAQTVCCHKCGGTGQTPSTQFKYFCAYAHSGGFGNAVITLNNSIAGNDNNIRAVQNKLAERGGLKDVILLNYKLMSSD